MWILTNDRLPDTNWYCLLATAFKKSNVRTWKLGSYRDGEWRDQWGEKFAKNVEIVAWQYVPELP
jgi:hypothetical protein